MEGFIAFGYFLVVAALVAFASGTFIRGFKEGIKAPDTFSSKEADLRMVEDEATIERDQILLLLAKRKRLVKNAIWATLILGVWLICVGSLHDSLENRQSLAFLICKGVEECAIQTASAMKPTLELCLWSSVLIFTILYAFAFTKWLKLVTLTGKVRNATAMIPIEVDSLPNIPRRANRTQAIVGACIIAVLLIGFLALRRSPDTAASTVAPHHEHSAERPQTQQVQIVGSDGFWVHKMGLSSDSFGEGRVLLDNQGKAYLEVKGVAVLLEESAFRNAFPGSVLIVKRINVDQLRQLVQSSPGNVDVQLVTALCKQRIPVMTFTEAGLTDAENLPLSEACAFVGGQSSIQLLVGKPAASETLAKAVTCNRQESGVQAIQADLAGDGSPFTITYGICEEALGDNDGFVIIKRDEGRVPAVCAIGIPVTEHLYYMKIDSTETQAKALHIKGYHREDDTFNSFIQVRDGKFIFTTPKDAPDASLHCE